MADRYRRRVMPEQMPAIDQILAELLRERSHPRPGERHYPHLRDLREALRDVTRSATGIWLDYGAATSPYRDLFVDATLATADMAASTWRYPVDYLLGDDGAIPAPDETFDGVLSTQVLEHVEEPADYLREARRVLKPGGQLVLTTHGVWEDHSPIDMWRWTAQGLHAEVERAGFMVDRCLTLTCGARARLHLLLRECRVMEWPGFGPPALLLRGVRALDRWRPGIFDRYSDRHLSSLGRADAGEQSFYLALLISAKRGLNNAWLPGRPEPDT